MNLRDAMLALAEEWRYKGEFGWGPWQAGEGPDIEGIVLDDAAARIRAAVLAADPEPREAVVERMARAMAGVGGLPVTDWQWRAACDAGQRAYFRRLAASALDASQGGTQ